MNITDVATWAEKEASVFLEAYQRSPASGHAEKYHHYRDIAKACRDAQHLLDAYGLAKRDGHE